MNVINRAGPCVSAVTSLIVHADQQDAHRVGTGRSGSSRLHRRRDGKVTGFVYLWPNFPFPDFCPAHQSVVPVHICYQPTDLVDFVEPFDVYWFPEGTTVCGPIEPD